MDNVVPHLTEGLIELCKSIPEDPTDYLANTCLKEQILLMKKIEKLNRKKQMKRIIQNEIITNFTFSTANYKFQL